MSDIPQFPSEPPEQRAARLEREPVVAKKKVGCGTWVVIAIVVVVVLAAFGSKKSDSDNPAPAGTKDHSAMAFTMCKEFVKGSLKSPGSAKFRNEFEEDGEVTVSGYGDGPFVVRSSVDSQNGFGALLRSNFVCTVSYTGDDNWKLDDLTLDGA